MGEGGEERGGLVCQESERSLTALASEQGAGRGGTRVPAFTHPPARPPAPRRPLISRTPTGGGARTARPASTPVLSLHGAPPAAAAPRPGAGPGSPGRAGGPRQVALPAGAAAQPAPRPAARVSRRPPGGGTGWGRAGQSHQRGRSLEAPARREVGRGSGRRKESPAEEGGGRADQRPQTQARA